MDRCCLGAVSLGNWIPHRSHHPVPGPTAPVTAARLDAPAAVRSEAITVGAAGPGLYRPQAELGVGSPVTATDRPAGWRNRNAHPGLHSRQKGVARRSCNRSASAGYSLRGRGHAWRRDQPLHRGLLGFLLLVERVRLAPRALPHYFSTGLAGVGAHPSLAQEAVPLHPPSLVAALLRIVTWTRRRCAERRRCFRECILKQHSCQTSACSAFGPPRSRPGQLCHRSAPSGPDDLLIGHRPLRSGGDVGHSGTFPERTPIVKGVEMPW
jgi:hypothetical protein